MAKYCTWCGAALEPGARFCGECGGRILETVTIDGSKNALDDLSGLDIVDGRKLPADATLRLDRDSVVVQTDTDQKRFTLNSSKNPRKTALIVTGALVAFLVAVAALLAAAYFGGWGQQEKEPIAVSGIDEQSESDKKEADDKAEADNKADGETSKNADASKGSAASKPEPKLTDTEIFNSLDAAYEKLDVYDERIATCVEEFNANFLANSMEVRAASKDFADKVLTDLENDVKGLESMEIPDESAYAQQVEDVLVLYECQIGRVSAMTNAWALDVTFEKPSEHKDEILACYTEGNAKTHLARYDELHASAKPTKAS
ncbi:MAG: zinc ribbon domain-containing protein [Slackia sp.]|nr:zinc ribbon domain-containing protein [Slackia sp.]